MRGKQEFTRFAQRVDQVNIGFFPSWKSLLQDRTITSWLAQNRRERPLRRSAHLLAHGVLLGETQLQEHEKARLSGMDFPNSSIQYECDCRVSLDNIPGLDWRAFGLDRQPRLA